MRVAAFLIISVLTIVSGCSNTQTVFVSVDSLAAPTAQQQRTYLLLPGNEGVTWDDLQFQEYAVYLMRVLNAQGFVSAERAEQADVAIVL
jgi:hypothetical protein